MVQKYRKKKKKKKEVAIKTSTSTLNSFDHLAQICLGKQVYLF